jgi:ASPIC and UnbV/FG-GAP-like repeat
VIAALVWVALLPAGASGSVAGFDRERLEIHDFHLFDLGTADHDDDGDLDLYTLNHLGRQSLLSNDGSGGFSERLFEARLSQTREFPGWEDQEGPEITGPGLYLASRSGVLLRSVDVNRVRGRVELLFRPEIEREGPGRTTIHRRRGPDPDRWVVRYELRRDARLRIEPPRKAQPYRVSVRAPFPLDGVFVGSQELHPRDRRFQLYLRDRHGMAWADLGGGPETDVFIVRGGLRGRITELVGAISDELLLGRVGSFRRAPAAHSIRKGACRGRAAGAIDFTGDGRLDLFATCKGEGPKLYRGTAAGRFSRAPALRRAGVRKEVMRFAQLDNDRAPEVLATFDRHFEVFERAASGWRMTQSLPARHSTRLSSQVAAADADNDGDQDLLVSSATGSTLLRNNEGRLHRLDPKAFGLPGAALASAWGDYDNDGDQDLAAVPGGLYRQDQGFEFARVGAFGVVRRPAEARIAWPDLDSDGARDPVISARSRGSARRFKTYAFGNVAPAGRWLEVDLGGKARNRQAVGARVRVRAGGETQTQWVGQNETSVYSQGHYRLYFGLGDQTSARVEVRWPGGRVRDFGSVAADQRLELSE